MKKSITLLTAFLTALPLCGISAFAEDSAVPAELPQSIYNTLLKKSYIDINSDGIIDEDELSQMNHLSIDLEDETDISWLPKLKNLEYLSIESENELDMSYVAQLEKLSALDLYDLPITDISFLKSMKLDSVHLENMEQITTEQRLDVMRWGDVTVQKGFMCGAGARPDYILGDSEIIFRVEDPEIADIEFSGTHCDENGRYYRYANTYVYGINTGTTKYSVTVDGEKVISGKITVTDSPESLLPPTEKYTPSYELRRTIKYKNIISADGKLYDFENGEMITLAENVSLFEKFYATNGRGFRTVGEMIQFNDNLIKFNENILEFDEKITEVTDEYFLTENGNVYMIYFSDEQAEFVHIADNIKNFIYTDSLAAIDNYILDNDGEVIYLQTTVNNGELKSSTYKTGIFSPKMAIRDAFIDGDGILWKVNFNSKKEPEKTKIAEDVVNLERRYLDNKSFLTDVYTTADGKVYSIETQKEITLGVVYKSEPIFRSSGTVGLDGAGGIPPFEPDYDYYHLGLDDTLYVNFNGSNYAISDVAYVISTEKVENEDSSASSHIYFTRTDNTVWDYSLESNELRLLYTFQPKQEIRGDVSCDGVFNVADLVLLSEYLLGKNVKLNEKNGDLIADGKLDVFDLCAMRKELTAMNN